VDFDVRKSETKLSLVASEKILGFSPNKKKASDVRQFKPEATLSMCA
jgi:hypothetical protein